MGRGGGEAVVMKDVVKVYPDGTVALRGVSLRVRSGEIHGLLGENGAGKTTLMRILYGEIRPSRGEVKVFGRRVSFKGPWDAIREGICMVYQHFSLVPSFTVLENLTLSMSSIRRASASEVAERAREIMERTGLKVPLSEAVESLAVGVQQRVEILKALMRDARILILDEPTSVLTPVEVRELFNTLRRLKELGITVILITHKLREVKEVTDTVTVLRRGRVAGVVRTPDVSEAELAKMMVGREVVLKVSRRPRKPGGAVLEVRDLWVRGERGVMAVKGVTLSVREGEILGIAGVQGNGQRELAEALAGLRRVEKGRVLLMGRDITNRPPSEIYMMGLAYIPDSRSVGLIMELNLVNNSILTRLKRFLGRGSRVLWGRALSFTNRVVKEFNVVVESVRTPVRYLSGGNQQKVMVGREVASGPKVIVASEPTHGLDVGATEYIRNLLVRLRDEGRAVVLISTDLDEILQLSDRVAVMYEGRVMAVGRPEEFTLERLGLLMGGVSA